MKQQLYITPTIETTPIIAGCPICAGSNNGGTGSDFGSGGGDDNGKNERDEAAKSFRLPDGSWEE